MAFLRVLAATANVGQACKTCHINRWTAYDHRGKFPEFAAKWTQAEADACDDLEAHARKMALSGNPILTIFLLKAHRPEKFRDNYTPISAPAGDEPGPVKDYDSELAKHWKANASAPKK